MDDTAIIDLYWQRSEEAIEVTAGKYGAYCTAIAQNILGNHSDAEECVNDTYLGVWNSIPTMRPTLFRPFIGKIARNLALTRFDYNHAQKRNPNLVVILEELEECITAPGVEECYSEKETAAAINVFLEELPPLKRRIFVRRYWYGDSIKSIAQHFCISESKTKSMLFHTRKKLQAHLQKEGIVI